MAKLTEDVVRVFENQPETNTVLVAAGEKIFKGSIVGCTTTGFARPYQAGDTLMGIALEQADNTNGVDGENTIDVKGCGKVSLEIDGISQDSIGSAVYVSDDNTFSLDESGGAYLGKVIRIEEPGVAIVAFDCLYMPELTTTASQTQESHTEG